MLLVTPLMSSLRIRLSASKPHDVIVMARPKVRYAVQQPCSNLSHSSETSGKLSVHKSLDLQEFCNHQKTPANYRAAFARRRSGVRIPSAPLIKILQTGENRRCQVGTPHPTTPT